MRTPRIYQTTDLAEGMPVDLDTQASVHVSRVLRLKTGNPLVVFNGRGGEYHGEITAMNKRTVTVTLNNFVDRDVESGLKINLIQGVSRSDRMDFTMQKSVELGVTGISPVLMQHSSVNIDPVRLGKKHNHWQNIVISACEQCGRNRVPVVEPIQTFSEWLGVPGSGNVNIDVVKIVLHTEASRTLNDVNWTPEKSVVLFVGPEGGFSPQEIGQLAEAGFVSLRLGPRTLRTETAAIAAMSVLQYLGGDFVV